MTVTHTLAVTYTFDVEVPYEHGDLDTDTTAKAVAKFQDDERSYVPSQTRDIEVIA